MVDLHLEHDFTLNKDGSGKVVLRWAGPPSGPEMDPAAFVREEVARA